MSLWQEWYRAVAALRPACARTRNFLWLVLVLAAFSISTTWLGSPAWSAVTGLRPPAITACSTG